MTKFFDGSLRALKSMTVLKMGTAISDEAVPFDREKQSLGVEMVDEKDLKVKEEEVEIEEKIEEEVEEKVEEVEEEVEVEEKVIEPLKEKVEEKKEDETEVDLAELKRLRDADKQYKAFLPEYTRITQKLTQLEGKREVAVSKPAPAVPEKLNQEELVKKYAEKLGY